MSYRIVMLLLVVSVSPALADTESWTRTNVDGADLSFEHPSTWRNTPDGSEAVAVLREHPPFGQYQAGLSVFLRDTDWPLSVWLKYLRNDDLPARFPGSVVAREIEPQGCPRPSHLLHVTGLGGRLRGYDLLEAIVHSGERVVFFSLYFESGRADEYERILLHVVRSVGGMAVVDAAAAVEASPLNLAPPARNEIDWVGTLDEAFERARTRNVPVMICIAKDGIVASDQLIASHYRNAAVVSLSRGLVCVVASPDDHVGNGGGGICPKFGRVSCADHQATEIRARTEYLRSSVATVPQHLFCGPAGRLLAAREHTLSRTELSRMMREAIQETGRLLAENREGATPSFSDEYLRAADPFVKQWMIADAVDRGRLDDIVALLEEAESRKKTDLLASLLDGLGFAGDPRGCAPVVRFLDHALVPVRNHAAVALEQIGCPSSVERLAARLGKERSSKVRKNLLRALGRCGRGNSEIAALLLREARSGPALYRINAILALEQFRDAPDVVVSLMTLLEKEGHHEVMAAAAWTLSVFGETSCVALIERAEERTKRATSKKVLRAALEQLRPRGTGIGNARMLVAKLARDEIRRRY